MSDAASSSVVAPVTCVTVTTATEKSRLMTSMPTTTEENAAPLASSRERMNRMPPMLRRGGCGC